MENKKEENKPVYHVYTMMHFWDLSLESNHTICKSESTITDLISKLESINWNK